MAVIRTVGGLRKALEGVDPSLPVRVTDYGSSVRPWQLFQVTDVDEGTHNDRPTAFVVVRPARS